MRAFHKLSQGLREDRESHGTSKSRSLRPLQMASDQISPARQPPAKPRPSI